MWADRVIQNLGWFGGFYTRKETLKRSAQVAYMTCAEQGSVEDFYRICKLPDTFHSWFLVVHLHLWICMVRLKQEGKDGAVLYKQMVAFFWEDVEHRIRLLEINDRQLVGETTKELFKSFRGLLLAYDEGIVGDDTVLASALWRNMFHACKETANAQDVALLLEYVRKEVKSFDGQSSTPMLDRGVVQFGAFLPPKK